MGRTPAATGGVAAYSVVVPTVGRPALAGTLLPLLGGGPHAPAEVVVVDDRPRPEGPPEGADAPGITLVRSGGRGPACARDLGWRRTNTPWVVFLDDDVLPGADWITELAADLGACGPGVGGSQGRIAVPPPDGRRPTDAERGTLALAEARWITADMAYRRSALEDVDGFDRRFKRAYREDTDIALRVLDAGYELVAGARRSSHPMVSDTRLLRSVDAQAGNADDALMRRLHGRHWRERVGEPRGRLPRHVLTTAALVGATAAVGAAAVRAAHAGAAARPSERAAAGTRAAGVLGAGPEWSGAAVNAAFGARLTPGAAATAALLHPHPFTRATAAGAAAAALPGPRPRSRAAAAALAAALTSGRGLPATLAAATAAALAAGVAPTRPTRPARRTRRLTGAFGPVRAAAEFRPRGRGFAATAQADSRRMRRPRSGTGFMRSRRSGRIDMGRRAAQRLGGRPFVVRRGAPLLRGSRWSVRARLPVATAKAPSHAAWACGGLAAGLGLLWLAATAEFAWRRIAPGPRSGGEVARMAVTSALIPPAAVAQRLAGEWRHRGARPHAQRPVKAVLFDRDGTLVHDVPYNADPGLVRPTPGARAALDRVRAAGLRLGVVSNQSGVARGLITTEQLDAVNAAVEDRLGPFDVWRVCTHGENDDCACRKPRPGLILDAAAELGVAPEECAVIGDIGADVDAARAAGAPAVLVPTAATRPEETAAAPRTAPRIGAAVRRVLRWSRR